MAAAPTPTSSNIQPITVLNGPLVGQTIGQTGSPPPPTTGQLWPRGKS